MVDNAKDYDALAKQKVLYLKQTQSLIPFQDEDFVMLEQLYDLQNLEQSLMMVKDNFNQEYEKQQMQRQQLLKDLNQPLLNEFKNKLMMSQMDFKVQSNHHRLRADSVEILVKEEYDTLEEASDKVLLMNSQVQHEPIIMNKFQVHEDYQDQLDSQGWINLLQNKQFDFRINMDLDSLYKVIELSVNFGMNEISKEGRCAAWQLMLGIDTQSEAYSSYQQLYRMFVQNQTEPKSPQQTIETILIKDVYRTFSTLHLFNQNPSTGENKLYNVLKAYSFLDQEVGYTQGMSFICAMILVYVTDDEELAFTMFDKLLQLCEWRSLYLFQTPKLFDLTKIIRTHMQQELPKLDQALKQHNVILESLFASPFLTLFSNLIPMDQAIRVLDRFILYGQRAVLDIMKNLLKEKEKEMLKMDCWDLQVYLGRKIYENAIEENNFFPPFQKTGQQK